MVSLGMLAWVLASALSFSTVAATVEEKDQAAYLREHYRKQEVRIPMRDGVKLFTSIYQPKDDSRRYPILMKRTPYSVRPYGENEWATSLGPNFSFVEEGFIFVNQDVRGCFLSEGKFVNMTPHVAEKSSPLHVDESTDTYDTIEWLIKNLEGHNDAVGMWGISYPGFYAAAGMIDSHPALKAVSPQAPIADWYFDDFHHHGAFFLPHAFRFMASFGQARPEPTTISPSRFAFDTPDGYDFYLRLGPLSQANERYLHGKIAMWNEMVEHPDYDEYWEARNILPHLKGISAAVMVVGGWYDAEDLYGPLKIYRNVERNNPGIFNILVMGPWRHGGWARDSGISLGDAHFGAETSADYQAKVELPFFRRFLKGEKVGGLHEAHVFETGSNRWRTFDQWPPHGLAERSLFLRKDGQLSFGAPEDEEEAYDAFLSDPDCPVPFTEDIAIGMTREYMTDDQRFASRRPDVLTFSTAVLTEDLTVAGPVLADLWVSTSQSAADWVVKLIDVHPGDAEAPQGFTPKRAWGGCQRMVRSEVIRGRYRNSYAEPEPFVAGEPAHVRWELQDVLHTFQKGHRLMIQVQSSWFPLVDRNPQKYVDNIFLAKPEDFVLAEHRVYRSRNHPSLLRIGILQNSKK